jgi:large subunit ribosomal protein L24
MSIARIKKNDTVVAISGTYAGQTGKVLRVDHGRGLVFVEGLNLVSKSVRRSKDKPDGGFDKVHKPLGLCKVMPYDADLKKGVRIARVRDGDKPVRRVKGANKLLD